MTNATSDFEALWTQMLGLAEELNDQRMKAVIENHSSRKERICRKFGVVCSNDIMRLKNRKTKGRSI